MIELGGERSEIVGDVRLSEDEVLEFYHHEKTIVSIDGIWDLPMHGAEQLDVEHRYQALTDGPEVTLTNIDGTFVN